MKFQLATVLAIAFLTAISFINAPYPNELKFQHAPTFMILVGMSASAIWFRASHLSFLCITSFLLLHILGARWIYTFVPYDRWSNIAFGFELSERFGWQRNHYDRWVHFASGVLLVAPASECLQRLGRMRPAGAAIMSIAVVLAIGAIYEIAEWQIAMLFSPATAEAYNGQQGDMWDPQKDMALAWLGGTLAAVIVFRHRFA